MLRTVPLNLGAAFGAALGSFFLVVTTFGSPAGLRPTPVAKPIDEINLHIGISSEIEPLDPQCEQAVADLTAELEKEKQVRRVDFAEGADVRLLVRDCWVHQKAAGRVDETHGGVFVPDPKNPSKGAFVNQGSLGVKIQTRRELAFNVRLIAGSKFEDFLASPKDDSLGRAVRTVTRGVKKWLAENKKNLARSQP